jgi:hypothetical protein
VSADGRNGVGEISVSAVAHLACAIVSWGRFDSHAVQNWTRREIKMTRAHLGSLTGGNYLALPMCRGKRQKFLRMCNSER